MWWDAIRNPSTIRSLLGQVYADVDRVGDTLVEQIVLPTTQPAAASAFASILCSPGSSISFDDMMERVADQEIPLLLCYGKEDPWIQPIWGHRAKRVLTKVFLTPLNPLRPPTTANQPSFPQPTDIASSFITSHPASSRTKLITPRRLQAPYMELSPAGHCPHHEVPEAVNHLFKEWVRSSEMGIKDGVPVPEGNSISVDSTVDGRRKTVSITSVGVEPRTVFEFFDSVINKLWRITRRAS